MHNLQQAIKILKSNGIVIYPTDTAYAIGCKFKNKKSIQKILKIKKRKDTKFTLIAFSLAQVKRYFKLNACQIKLAKKYWPGPVSIVVSPKYSVRVPKNKIARQLARACGMPIIATSLNVSGDETTYNMQNIVGTTLELSLHKNHVFTINAGPLTKRKTSTIVKCLLNQKIKIIRHGSQRIKLSS